MIGDEYGAITLALTDAGRHGIRVHQDLATGRRALERNAEDLGLAGFTAHELDAELLSGARLVLLQLPKSLAELEEIADAVARWSASDVVLVAGGRVKHMTLAQNEVLGRSFAHVQPQRAERKSRLIEVSDARPVPADPPFPVAAQHDGLTLVAHGGAFAGARLDIGTRVLLEVLGSRAEDPYPACSTSAAAPAHSGSRMHSPIPRRRSSRPIGRLRQRPRPARPPPRTGSPSVSRSCTTMRPRRSRTRVSTSCC